MLENIEDSTLAEYFVNLFISMKIKIPPSKFNEFCNTQMDEKLFPIFTARGEKADFQYIDKKNKKVIVVETTIIKTESSITKVEFEPIARHFLNYVEENDATKYKHVLIFVSYYKNEWMTKLMDWTIERGMQELWKNDKNLNCKVSQNIRFDELFNIEV
ncbi:AlwI family type II restriction endonuclease [Metamycoplasma hyosynoviae]|nr:AlwI family type II restriction endonuclease [Metamycoplasma hyosynoviae]MDC8913763.1 AlwI family type II restriction endonuclease [Metamycoplasma hyosynoviae]